MFLLDPLQCGNNGGGQVKQLGWVAMDLSYYKIASPTANHTHFLSLWHGLPVGRSSTNDSSTFQTEKLRLPKVAVLIIVALSFRP